MGRKRKNVEMARINIVITKELKDKLSEAGVNYTQLFLNAAHEYLKKCK